jgi:hypothetical protein
VWCCEKFFFAVQKLLDTASARASARQATGVASVRPGGAKRGASAASARVAAANAGATGADRWRSWLEARASGHPSIAIRHINMHNGKKYPFKRQVREENRKRRKYTK